ncbi:hypothetical protein BN946_scf184714.g11 [Trametes cinnabarina]|uniref:F-box domain-containing protein n=1 Tax=Pycnoporus cinnabarinus TaxID=5643 RepID=A0A060SUP8_PYCCI|nr:hypothetical protein BN946_scf184714.g11 [Trametes cinnabarina]
MSVLTLPTEVVELILINAAAAGHPETIAAFSQTSRAHRDLVYGPSDQHLWREIFLTTFDDPRVTGGGPGWFEGNAQKAGSPKDPSFNWGEEYRKRIWAARYIRRQTNPQTGIVGVWNSDLSHFVPEYETTERNTRALDALISVIDTAAPCPATIVFSFIPPCDGPASAGSISAASAYPTFPPLPQAIGGSSKGIVPVGPFDGSGRGFGQALSARNMAWLQSVLACGYPPAVTARFSGQKWDGGIAGQYLEEDDFRLMQSAGRLIACTGFLPVPHPDADAESPETPPAGDGISDRLPPPEMSEEKQRKRARRLARMRVYNMRYLARERHWGPYLPHMEQKVLAPRAPIEDDELLQPILALFRFAPENGDGVDENEDGHLHEGADEEEGGDGDDSEEEEGEDGEEDDVDASAGPRLMSAPPLPPTPAQLRADWGYLAAVRTVIEANLRETFSEENLSGLLSLDGLRPGSAPWDADQYKMNSSGDESTATSKGKGKEKATEWSSDSDEVEGWDWAGVTGLWKRCVCWMDYRDLILHNYFFQLSGEFEDPHLAEAVRIIAMRLRVKSYSRCTVPGYEHLPTIHVVGETSGASISGQPRRIHGTVGIIADGSVRWNLQFSSVEGADEDEWVSEGIQVGGVASAMGVLGMWTGANHERMDPLGKILAITAGSVLTPLHVL